MNSKTTLVLIALLGVGLFALPQTTALFAGQHGFVNIDPTGNQIECVKCHGDIEAELASEHNTVSGTDGPHADMKCEFCHRLQIGQSSGDSAYAMVEYQGVAVQTNLTDMTNKSVTARRFLIMKTADYEAQKYPATISNSPSVKIQGTMATAGGSLSALLVSDANFSYNYSATSFGWNNTGGPCTGSSSSCVAGVTQSRARQTDVINQTTGKGTITFVARGTIYALYEGTPGEPLDQNESSRYTAFDPTKVTWENATSVTSAPISIFNNSGSRTVNSGSRYHAASLVACMDCHAGSSPQPGHETARLGQTNPDDEEYCAHCHYGGEVPGSGELRTYALSAGGFGGITNEAFDSGEAEVHKALVKNDPNNPAVGVFGGRIQPASNAGCIACHTHVEVDITYTRPTTLTFDASKDASATWTVGGFGAGTATTITHS